MVNLIANLSSSLHRTYFLVNKIQNASFIMCGLCAVILVNKHKTNTHKSIGFLMRPELIFASIFLPPKIKASEGSETREFFWPNKI